MIAALRLRRDDRPDAPVELRRRFWKIPALAESDTVPTLLIYADLLADGDPRLIEAAAEVRGSDADFDASTNPERVSFPEVLIALCDVAQARGVEIMLVGATVECQVVGGRRHFPGVRPRTR